MRLKRAEMSLGRTCSKPPTSKIILIHDTSPLETPEQRQRVRLTKGQLWRLGRVSRGDRQPNPQPCPARCSGARLLWPHRAERRSVGRNKDPQQQVVFFLVPRKLGYKFSNDISVSPLVTTHCDFGRVAHEKDVPSFMPLVPYLLWTRGNPPRCKIAAGDARRKATPPPISRWRRSSRSPPGMLGHAGAARGGVGRH